MGIETAQESEGHLYLKKLELFSFRNHHHLLLEDIGKRSIFIGNNATGKTSILEAIQLSTALQSFRTHKNDQLIEKGCVLSKVVATFEGNKRSLIEKIEIKENKRKYDLNGKQRSQKELKGMVPAVLFTPDDLYLVKGSHSQRRASFDYLGSQISKNYNTVVRDYQKITRQKNQAMKEEFDKGYIEGINDVLAKVAAQLLIHRRTLILKLKPFLETFYSELTGGQETVDIIYNPSWNVNFFEDDKETIEESLKGELLKIIDEEMVRKRCVVGPHADEIDFLVDGNNALHFASQGQQRSIVLAYKMAELEITQNTVSQQPLLLLDDVMSELDEQRRRRFIDFIGESIQTFITTTNLDYFDDLFLEKSDVYTLPFE